jgi:ElaB/YqjD/DUF883 family membrane-anchored ribosome-binding protein
MPADSLSPANEATEATASAKRAAKAAVASAMDASQDKINDALDMAERNLNEAAKRVEKVLREGVEALKSQTAPYRENAGQQLDEAQKYVMERVKERPVTATLAGLGVGLLLGLLLAGGRSNR